MTASTSIQHLLYVTTIATFALLSTGCIWRTSEVDYIWGPALIRMNQPLEGSAYLWQERPVFPITVEGGTQVGITIGILDRVAANPIENKSQTSIHWCSGLFVPTCLSPTAMDGWLWSILHSRIFYGLPPEFYDRSILGASLEVGSDGYHMTLGYSANTQHKPRDNAYYILCYRREHLLQARFAVAGDVSEFISFLNQEAC